MHCVWQVEDTSQDALIDKNFVQIVKNLQRLRGIDGNNDDSGTDKVERRRTIQNLEKNRQKKRPIGTLDVAFKQRFFNMTSEGGVTGEPTLSSNKKYPINNHGTV
jgi:chitin synthase